MQGGGRGGGSFEYYFCFVLCSLPPSLSQWEAERQSSESLQKLLSSERKKEFQAYHTSQEREGDMQQLRQQLARLEADRLSLTEQLRSVRSEAAVKTEENQRLKSELASEKFQRYVHCMSHANVQAW